MVNHYLAFQFFAEEYYPFSEVRSIQYIRLLAGIEGVKGTCLICEPGCEWKLSLFRDNTFSQTEPR